jgi:hypothetical protein
MRTTQDDIREWLKRAPKDATHMLVVCDTFSKALPTLIRDLGIMAGQARREGKTERLEALTDVLRLIDKLKP